MASMAVSAVPWPVMKTTSSLVGKQKWGREVLPCWRCGFSPVRHEVTRDNHSKEFAYACPNEDCEEYWKSPPMQLRKHSKTDAANVWDDQNRRANRKGGA